jgi:hypothetical protein
MADIRPLERDDLPHVASLYERVARSGSHTAPPGLVEYFERTLLDHPWADDEIPSLVYVKAGRIAGFLGSSVRRLRFDGRPIRLGVSGQLVTDPEIRNRAAGAFLMREYMNGAQDLMLTDTASDTVRRIWAGIGGTTNHLCCVGWVGVFRPLRFALDLLSRRDGRAVFARAGRPFGAALDAVAVRLARGTLRPGRPDGSDEELTPPALAEHVAGVTGSARLRPEYEDEDFVRWLLREIGEIRTRGELVARLVRDGRGRVVGWYVYNAPPGGIAQVLQITGHDRGIDVVLDHLLHDAWSRGACAIQGRVEAHLLDALASRRCLLHASGYLTLIHSRDEELLHAIQSGEALLTRLEGEWWMGHHLLSFGQDDGA